MIGVATITGRRALPILTWCLADLIKIFHPDLLPEHELIWFHQLQ